MVASTAAQIDAGTRQNYRNVSPSFHSCDRYCSTRVRWCFAPAAARWRPASVRLSCTRRLLEPDLQRDPVGLDFAGSKTALGDQALKSIGGVSAVSESGQDSPRDEPAHRTKLLALHLAVDVGARCLLAQVLDNGPATRSQNAIDPLQDDRAAARRGLDRGQQDRARPPVPGANPLRADRGRHASQPRMAHRDARHSTQRVPRVSCCHP